MFLALVVILFLLGGCGPSGPGDAGDDATPGVDADAAADGQEILLDPDFIRAWPIMRRIRLDVPTPAYPLPGSIMRNVISVVPHDSADDDSPFTAADCREPDGLQVTFSWQGVHGGAIATLLADGVTTVSPSLANPFQVTSYDLCVSTDTDPATKCTGSDNKNEIYKIDPPRSYYEPPNGLPSDKFYLKNFSWQVRACRELTVACGEWSDRTPMAWAFAGPLPLSEETMVRADGSIGLNLHHCNVNKSGVAASDTYHVVCMAKAESFTANPSRECQTQNFSGNAIGDVHWIRHSSNSPEGLLGPNDIPASDGDNMWTVGACNPHVDNTFCGWSQIPPRIFVSPF